MNQVNINAIFKLRRDNDYNYNKIKDTYIPFNGEMILVDTARNGLRAKIGDGVTTYANLPFTDEIIANNIIIHGYLYENQFYSDSAHTILVPAAVNKIYVDIVKNTMYFYDGRSYINTNNVAMATGDVAGIMKLYNTIGDNEDGTMTQKAISDELDDKVELDVREEEELLVFFYD